MHTFPSYIANVFLLWLLFAIMLPKGMCTLRAQQCNQKDRHILLNFKHATVDPSASLSSWSHERDCCQWKGVQCSNTTARVTMLRLPCFTQLSNYKEDKSQCLTGELDLSLLHLEFLIYLDLSNNDFKAIRFDSRGNSSNLHYLDLSFNDDLKIGNLQWLSHFSSLKYIFFSGINLQKETNWLQLANMLPLLKELHLLSCQLRNIYPSLQYANFSSLEVLDLSYNDFGSQFLPNWLFNFTGDFSAIYLNDNSFRGQLPKRLLNLRKIKSLELFENELSGPIPNWLGQLEHLQTLNILGNLFYGPIPSTLGNLSSLIYLDVSKNHLNGSLPESLGQLENLNALGIGDNSLTGVVSQRNLAKLSNLKSLFMGSPGVTFEFDSLWIPPFQLRVARLDYMGPKLPTWLYTQTSLTNLMIYFSRISFEPQDKFWDFAAQTKYLSLRYNKIKGSFSHILLNSTITILESNNIKSSLPRLSPNVVFFNIQNNSMSGSISSLLCQKMNGRSQLGYLDMSNNILSGGLTDCWMNWKSLIVIKLGNNNLTGTIPPSLGFLSNLTSLNLNNNNLFGEVPQSLENCKKLKFLDLGVNKFSGNMPNWIGHNVEILILRSNRFSGTIPLQICQSTSLIVLDLACNRISGPIPICLCNITALSSKNRSNVQLGYVIQFGKISYDIIEDFVLLLIKGQELEYGRSLRLVRAIDLSSNNMSGMIPPEIFSLTELHSLNLSHNQFTGNIPKEIGNLKQLESLDLSRNQFSGEIPQSMSELSFLSSLNMSFNNFSGKIPSGTQLQGFGALSFIGNPDLCGDPLPKNCTHEDVKPIGEDDKNEFEFMSSLYMGMGVGFATAFWGVCGAIFFSRTCRHTFFKFLDHMKDKLYVMVVLKMNRFH